MAGARAEERRGHAAGLAAEVAEAGLLGGFTGGLAMLAFVVIAQAIAGPDAWEFPRRVAATFGGAAALAGAGPVVLGIAVHLAVAGLLGLAFAAFVGRDLPLRYALLAGIAYGVAVLLFMTFAVLPSVNPPLRARVGSVPWGWFLAHLFFGAGVALVPAFRRRVAARVPEEGPYPPVRG